MPKFREAGSGCARYPKQFDFYNCAKRVCGENVKVDKATPEEMIQFGKENCNGWSTCTADLIPQVCEGGWDCYLSVAGYTAKANYVYQLEPSTDFE